MGGKKKEKRSKGGGDHGGGDDNGAAKPAAPKKEVAKKEKGEKGVKKGKKENDKNAATVRQRSLPPPSPHPRRLLPSIATCVRRHGGVCSRLGFGFPTQAPKPTTSFSSLARDLPRSLPLHVIHLGPYLDGTIWPLSIWQWL